MRYFWLFLLSLFIASPALAGKTLTFNIPTEEPEFINYVVLKAAYANLGITAKIHRLPAQRSLIESDAGNSDGEVGRIREVGDQYYNLIRVLYPIGKIEYVAFVADESLTFSNVSDLRPYKIGILNGFKFAERATATMPDVYRGASWDNLFDLLQSNRLDVVFAPKRALLTQWNRSVYKEIKPPSQVLATDYLYHYLHERHSRLAPEISKQLEAITVSGEADRLREKAFQRFVQEQSSK